MPTVPDRAQALRAYVLDTLGDGRPSTPSQLYGQVAQLAQTSGRMGTVLHAQVRSAVLDLVGDGKVRLTNDNNFVVSRPPATLD